MATVLPGLEELEIARQAWPGYGPIVDLRTRTSLFCGALALAIGISTLLRGKIRRPAATLSAFAINMGLWYLAQWWYQWERSDVAARLTAVLAILLPQSAIHLFESLVPHPRSQSILVRTASLLMVPVLVLALSPWGDRGWARTVVFFYVFGLIAAGLGFLALRGERSGSFATQRRVRFLVLIGTLANGLSLSDFLWFIGAPLPPIGAVLTILFLYVLAQSLTRERLVDLYDLLGHWVLNATLAFCLAGIFYVFVVLFGGFETMYLGAIVAAVVILVLFEPLRQKMESTIHNVFFRERAELERAVGRARAQLVHVLEVSEMSRVVLSSLEESRRATAGALYLRDPIGNDFLLVGSFGPPAIARIDLVTARTLVERLDERGSLVLENLGTEAAEQRRRGQLREAESDERVLGAADVLGPFKQGVCLGIHGGGPALLGILCLADDRVRDAFSSDDVGILEPLVIQASVVLENSRQYRRMRDRDKLTALGQMAAGLAHEIKNPLGAIKGAAQLLGEDQYPNATDPSSREFIRIILDEVERLDRLVGSVLDYARPSKGNPGLVDANALVRRTLQLLATERKEGVTIEVQLADDVAEIRADPEQLRQVLINLVRNAEQAMNARGVITITTWQRRGWRPAWSGSNAGSDWVEIAIRDEGPGIQPQVLDSLFVPFFTTKIKGTGLGLAISQRLVEAMGGRIQVASRPGQGSTFSVVLPAATVDTTPRPATVLHPVG